MNPYPEHDKLRAVVDQSQAIGEFIEWLHTHGYYICERRKPANDDYNLDDVIDVPPGSRREKNLGETFCDLLRAMSDAACVYWPTPKRLPDSLLAEYFDIDQTKLDDEKRAMLERLRDANAGAH